jgi:hypothetical protein
MLSFERYIHQKTFERNFLRGTTSEQQLHLGRTGAVETEEDALNQIASQQQTRCQGLPSCPARRVGMVKSSTGQMAPKWVILIRNIAHPKNAQKKTTNHPSCGQTHRMYILQYSLHIQDKNVSTLAFR